MPLCSRTNGWSWPPHPFQVLAWLLYVYFAITGFGVFVPLLPPHWMPAGYIVSLQDALTTTRAEGPFIHLVKSICKNAETDVCVLLT